MDFCDDVTCEGSNGFGPGLAFPELPAGARYCPFCGNELVPHDDEDE